MGWHNGRRVLEQHLCAMRRRDSAQEADRMCRLLAVMLSVVAENDRGSKHLNWVNKRIADILRFEIYRQVEQA